MSVSFEWIVVHFVVNLIKTQPFCRLFLQQKSAAWINWHFAWLKKEQTTPLPYNFSVALWLAVYEIAITFMPQFYSYTQLSLSTSAYFAHFHKCSLVESEWVCRMVWRNLFCMQKFHPSFHSIKPVFSVCYIACYSIHLSFE